MWPVWTVIAAIIGVVALTRGDNDRSEAGFAILTGLVAMQGVREVMSPHYWWVASFLIWVSCGALIAVTQRSLYGASGLAPVFLLVSGVFYPIGYYFGDTFAAGSLSLLGADVMGLAALFVTGGPIIVGFFKDFCSGARAGGGSVASRFLRGISGAESRKGAV